MIGTIPKDQQGMMSQFELIGDRNRGAFRAKLQTYGAGKQAAIVRTPYSGRANLAYNLYTTLSNKPHMVK